MGKRRKLGDRRGLSVRAGTQAGWSISLEGADRCRKLGHEAENVLNVQNGMMVAYCVRCGDRFEMPWFRGGSASALARVMAAEAMAIDEPDPSVFDDLNHANGLLCDDACEIVQAKALLAKAISVTLQRM